MQYEKLDGIFYKILGFRKKQYKIKLSNNFKTGFILKNDYLILLYTYLNRNLFLDYIYTDTFNLLRVTIKYFENVIHSYFSGMYLTKECSFKY